ncbi:MAG: alpha/beta hydrolase [Myxococcota bacterium]
MLFLVGCEIENSLLFQTDPTDRYRLPDNTIPVDSLQEVEILTSDSLRLAAIWARRPEDGPTVVFFHGQGGNIDAFWDRVMGLWDAGVAVLIVDYRGYGKSEGEPSEIGLYRDGRATLEFALGQGVEAQRLILWGASLGSAVATHVATEFEVGAVVLDGAFTSMEDMVAQSSPLGLPGDWVIESEWDNLSRVDELLGPVVIAHGRKDGVVPFSMGERLFTHAGLPKEFVAVDDGRHNDLIVEHLDVILPTVLAALD